MSQLYATSSSSCKQSSSTSFDWRSGNSTNLHGYQLLPGASLSAGPSPSPQQPAEPAPLLHELSPASLLFGEIQGGSRDLQKYPDPVWPSIWGTTLQVHLHLFFCLLLTRSSPGHLAELMKIGRTRLTQQERRSAGAQRCCLCFGVPDHFLATFPPIGDSSVRRNFWRVRSLQISFLSVVLTLPPFPAEIKPTISLPILTPGQQVTFWTSRGPLSQEFP